MKTNGKLYVIGTPIGNLKDVTLRALEKLDQVEVLVCEDSRVASRLINKYIELGYIENKPRYLACNEFNENSVWESVVELVREGSIVGLVSDAGMPLLSDPGYKVVRGCLDAGLEIEIIPGVTALTTALPWSGLGGEIILYEGFLPKGSGKATRYLEAAKRLGEELPSARLALYVSPHRIEKDLKLLVEVLGVDTPIVLLRELTKKHQQRVEMTLGEMSKKYPKGSVKGEIVLIVSLETN